MTSGKSEEESVRPHEVVWRDRDGFHARVIDGRETRLEQPAAPPDAAAMVEVGKPPKDGTVWADAAYATAEQAIEAGLLLVEAGITARQRDWESPVGLPEKYRWRAHVIACSLTDMTFWVRSDAERPGYHEACEVETGVSAWGTTAREAMENYFARKFDRPKKAR